MTDQALSDPAPNVPATSGHAPSSLLDYLPAIYREDPFLGQFLLAFEKVLLGRQDQVPWPKCGSAPRVAFPDRGLEETIAQLPTYCNPKVQASEQLLPWLAKQAPEEFLPWLAKWTAFSLRAALSADQQRDFIAHAIRLYRRRGTKQGMEELLRIFTGAPPKIKEHENPHHFRVEIDLRLSEKDQGKYAEYIRRQQAVAHALIRLEKPAHTTFHGPYLIFSVFKIGKAKIGIDTLLSTKPSEDQGHG